MTDNGIRAALSPLLIISYVFGTRIVEFPAGKPRLWLSLLYVLLLWSVYHVLLTYTAIHYVFDRPIVYHVCFRLNISAALLSIVLGIYYDKVREYSHSHTLTTSGINLLKSEGNHSLVTSANLSMIRRSVSCSRGVS